MIHTVLAAVPAANFWDTSTDFFTNLGKVLILGAGTGVAWFLLKEIFKIRSVLAGVIAVASAIFLGWGVNQYDNKEIKNMFTETITDSSGGGAQAPAKSGGGAQAPVKKG